MKPHNYRHISLKQEVTTPLRFRLQDGYIHSCQAFWHFQANQQLATFDLRLEIAPEHLEKDEAFLLKRFGRVPERVSEETAPVYAFRFKEEHLTPDRIALFTHLEENTPFIEVDREAVTDLGNYQCLGLSYGEVSALN